MNHLVLVLDLPWELKEMINQYLMKILIIRKLEKYLKFPRLWKFESSNHPDGYRSYHFTTGYHNFRVFMSRDSIEYGFIEKTYFIQANKSYISYLSRAGQGLRLCI